MCETDLVLDLLRTLQRRDCNGHARVRLGTARADPDRFRQIFDRYARGTYFEHVDLEVEEEDPVVACSCGYEAVPATPAALQHCPRCTETPELVAGTAFDVVEPEA